MERVKLVRRKSQANPISCCHQNSLSSHPIQTSNEVKKNSVCQVTMSFLQSLCFTQMFVSRLIHLASCAPLIELLLSKIFASILLSAKHKMIPIPRVPPKIFAFAFGPCDPVVIRLDSNCKRSPPMQ